MRVRRVNPPAPFCAGGFFYWVGGAFWLLTITVSVPGEAKGRRPPPIVREAEMSGQPCLSLDDVAATMGGHLHWFPVSKRVDLSMKSHDVQFYLESNKAVVDGVSTPLDLAPIKDTRGVWIPKSFFAFGPLATYFRKRMDLGPSKSIAVAATEPRDDSPALPLPASPVRAAKAEAETSKPPEAAVPDVPVDMEPEAVHAIRRIVIDPGHGGKDPGAVSPRGTVEKDVNLWMARELADALREKDFEVLLTRTDDSFVPLSERARLANRHKADLFISVHCNASLASKLRGFETYILSEHASDPHAADVARLENAALEFEGKPPSGSVQAVLRSLVKNANINRAAQLAAILDRAVAQNLSQPDLGVKQAAFYVLRGAEMPAILLELGFLTNRKEERLLDNRSYRERMIRAIENSIIDFDKKQQKK